MKKWICLLLCLLMVFPALAEEPDEQDIALTEDADTFLSDAPTDPDEVYAISDAADTTETRIDFGQPLPFVTQLLEVAEKEIGYVEGQNNYTKYGKWSGDPNAAWCAEFVCWCVDQVDQQQGTKLLTTVYPKYSGQNTGRDWFIKRGRFVYRKGNCPDWGYQWMRGDDHYLTKNEYIPRPGDLIFFSYNEAGDTEHVALVEYCSYDSNGEVIIHVIEGNNPSSVQRNRYRLDNSQVLGFGLCENLVDTTMRSGNRGDKVLWLQESLNKLGLLQERHLTGGFGGNTKKAVMQFQTEYMRGKTPNGIADRETQQELERQLEIQLFNDPDSWLVVE